MACAALRLGEGVALFLHADKNGLALVRLGRGIHHVEDALSACGGGEDDIDLLGDAVDGLAHLLNIQQIRAQRSHIEHAANGEKAAYAAGNGVVDAAQVCHSGHHGTCIGLGHGACNAVVLVELAEGLHGLLLVGKDLDDLLSLDHLLNIAVEGTEGLLLALEVDAALAADGLDYQQHQEEERHGDEGQQRVHHQHHYEGGNEGQHVGEETGKAVADHLRNGVHIVGKATHHITGEVGVKIGYRQLLHLIEQILTDGGHRPLGHIDHQAGVDIAAKSGDNENTALQKEHFQKAGKIAGDNIVVQNGLEKIARCHRGDGGQQQTQRHQNKQQLILAQISQQAQEGLFRVAGTLEAVLVRPAAARRSVGLSHCLPPPPAEIHRPHGRCRRSPSVLHACPVPRWRRHPAPK